MSVYTSSVDRSRRNGGNLIATCIEAANFCSRLSHGRLYEILLDELFSTVNAYLRQSFLRFGLLEWVASEACILRVYLPLELLSSQLQILGCWLCFLGEE